MKYFLFIILTFVSYFASAQSITDTAKSQVNANPFASPANSSDTVYIILDRADAIKSAYINGQRVQLAYGNASFTHARNGANITSDSVYFYSQTNIEFFSNVIVTHQNMVLLGDKVVYDGTYAKVRGRIVRMLDQDRKAELRTQFVDYNIDKNEGVYTNGGFLNRVTNKGDKDTIESLVGTYEGNTGMCTFTKDVEMKRNDSVFIACDTMYYDIHNNTTTFKGLTKIWNGNHFMQSYYGWNKPNEDAFNFSDRAYMLSGSREVWADSIYFNDKTKQIKAYKNIQVLDTMQDVMVFGDEGLLHDNPQTAIVTKNPSTLFFSETKKRETKIDTIINKSDTAYVQHDSLYIVKDTTVLASDTIYTVTKKNPYFGCDTCVITPEKDEFGKLDESNQPKAELPTTNMGKAGGKDLANRFGKHDGKTEGGRAQRSDNKVEQKGRRGRGRSDNKANDNAEKTDNLIDLSSSKKVDKTNAKTAVSKVDSALNKVSDSTKNKIGEITDSTKNKIQNILGALSDSTKNKIEETTDSTKNKIQNIFGALSDSTKNKIEGTTDSTKNKIQNILGEVSDSTKNTTDTTNIGAAKLPQDISVPEKLDSARIKATEDSLKNLKRPNTRDSVYREVYAYHNVKIFKPDFRAVCDSLIYNTLDSIGIMKVEPILWNDSTQITASLMKFYSKNRQMDHADFYAPPFVTMREDSVHFSQVSGKRMRALFRNNQMYRINVMANGQSVYYMREKKDISGVEISECSNIIIIVKNNRIQDVKYQGSPKSNTYPLDKVPDDSEKLKGFAWHGDLRPQSKEQLFNRKIRESQRINVLFYERPKFPVTRRLKK